MAQTLSIRTRQSLTNPLRPLSTKGSSGFFLDTIEIPVGTTNDTGILYITLPVFVRTNRLNLGNDILGGGCTMDIGFYTLNGDRLTFTEVSSTAYASAINMAVARDNQAPFRFESNNIDTYNYSAWQLAGLSTPPKYGEFYVGLKFPGAVTTAGTVTLTIGTDDI